MSPLLFPGNTGLGPRSAFQHCSKPFTARAKVNPLKIAGQTSFFFVCYLYKLILLLAARTIPPVFRFTLSVTHEHVGRLRAAHISRSQFPMESVGSEPGQLPLAANCKINISLKHGASRASQECLKSRSRICHIFFICKGEKSFQNRSMGSM